MTAEVSVHWKRRRDFLYLTEHLCIFRLCQKIHTSNTEVHTSIKFSALALVLKDSQLEMFELRSNYSCKTLKCLADLFSKFMQHRKREHASSRIHRVNIVVLEMMLLLFKTSFLHIPTKRTRNSVFYYPIFACPKF